MNILHLSRSLFTLLLAVAATATAQAQNLTTQSPLTIEQLMRELRIQGGNFVFTFDKPVYAHITTTVSQYPDAKQSTTEEFVSDQPSNKIELFFSASALFVGDYPRGDQPGHGRKMMMKLSDCKATNGTRIIHYTDKFAENRYSKEYGMLGLYSPVLPLEPKLNEEYCLHYYFKKGDPYEAKATICFLEKPEDYAQVKKFERDGTRTWKSATDGK